MLQDRRGDKSVFTYDSLRQLVAAQDPLDRVTHFEYCGCGSLSGMIDPLGQQTSWIHDVQGRVTAIVYADGSRVTLNYENTTSRLHSVVDETGQYKVYSYYLDDMIRNVSYPVATTPTAPVSYTYDPNYSRLVSMQDGVGATQYTYNPVTVPPALGATKLASVSGPLPNSMVTYQYDELGRVVGRAINGEARALTLDAVGRTTVETNALGTFHYAYFGATPQLASESYPNGQSNAYTYYGDLEDDRLLQVQHFKPGGALLSALGYSYNPLGEITSLTNQWDTLPAEVWQPSYDAACQLSEVISSGGPSTVSNYTYAYDASGNRSLVETNGVQNHYYYNALNQLVSAGPPSTNAIYAWDVENRLAAITQGANVSAISYDGFGRRCEILEKTNGSTSADNYFLWCDDEVCEERDSTGANVLRRFFPQGEMTLGVGGTNYYYTRDHLGSVREALNSSGTLVSRYTYDPYGRKSALQEGYKTSFGFSGDFVHQKSGLDLTWFRPYDSVTGRWLSRDPVANPWLIIMNSPGLAGLGQYLPPHFYGAGATESFFNGSGINLYEYSLDNPVNFIDPLGLSTVGVGLGVSGQFGPLNINWNIGIAADNHGDFGFYNAPGGGLGAGEGITGGLSFSASNAHGICDLAGPFGNVSVGGGAGLGASFEGFHGPSPHGNVTGGGFTIGAGIGAGGLAGTSYTWVMPIH